MKEIVLVKYGEMALKGLNKRLLRICSQKTSNAD